MRAAKTRNSSSSCRMPQSCWRIPRPGGDRRYCQGGPALWRAPRAGAQQARRRDLVNRAPANGQAGRKVLVVEYLKDPEKMTAAAERTREEGFVPYFAPRQLQCLNPPAVLNESGSLPADPA